MMPIEPGPPAGTHPARHTLVWLDSLHWQRYLLAKPPREHLAAAHAWFQTGRPAIARRPHAAEPAGISLGIPLSPANGRTRIALTVAGDAISKTLPPPLLAETIPAAPPTWQPALTQ